MKIHKFVLVSFLMMFVVGCQKPRELGYIDINETNFPGQMTQHHYGISEVKITDNDRLDLTGTIPENPQLTTIHLSLKDYKTPGSYPISLEGNQIGDKDFFVDWDHDTLYGTLNIVEADSIAKTLKANFSGNYIPNTQDTVQFPFSNGYMEIHY